ncbi:MAG: hypothetical protein GY719_07405 [bacterium]|nr:hypothetical protein [bacterium]
MFWRNEDKYLTRYLLGELPERGLTRLEEKLLADEEYFQRLRLVEDDLIDAYVQEEMTAQKSRRFEYRFLSSRERRDRIELARGLRRAAELSAETESSRAVVLPMFPRLGFRNALAAAAALATLSLSALLWQSWPPRSGDQIISAPVTTASLVLLPTVRSVAAELPTLVIGPTTEQVTLEFSLEHDGYSRTFLAFLKTSRGEELWNSQPSSASDATPAGRSVVFHPPVTVFSTGRFVIELATESPEGLLEVIGVYEFVVVARSS